MSISERQESITPQPSWPDLDVIRDLYTNKHFIRQMSPQWWSVEHTDDPRELMHFDDFIDRLEPLGHRVVGYPSWIQALPPMNVKDIYLYPEPTVPMSILTLDIEGQSLPFIVTARPYHEKEIHSDPFSSLLHEYPSIDKLREYNDLGNPIGLYSHFYPHIRGLFAGMRGSNAFWYTLYAQAEEPIKKALYERDLSFVHVYIDGQGWGTSTYRKSWYELNDKARDTDIIDMKKLQWPPFKFTFVSAEEFILNNTDENVIVRYPLDLEGFDNQLNIFISNRTHEGAHPKPVVLGIFAHNGNTGFTTRRGIARIKNRSLAEEISEKISFDFGIPVDTVLFTPRPGKPLYERVSA